MVKNQYIPNQMDIIFLDFDPQSGHEQKRRRPALVLSNNSFNKYTKLAIVCPITSNLKEFPLHVVLGDKQKIKGVVMCEQIKSIDFIARNAEFKEKMDKESFNEIIDIIKSCIDIEYN
jgi:mRNA interferase MazF